INHALTVNPHVYISCIKQFWNTAMVKHSGVICLPNEEIFVGLARMGYEKPSTKLTFYKAFFSTQWKFFIYNILHSLSAKRTSWNEFSLAMASTVICLSSGQRFNFSNYIFESLVRNVDSSYKFYMYLRFIQLIIQTNIADFSTYTTRYISPALTQKVFANMRRVRKGFSGVETPLFKSMLVVRDVAEEAAAQVPAQGDDVQEPAAEEVVTEVVPPTPTPPSPPSPVIPSSPPHQPPCPPQPQDAEVPSLLFQHVLDTCSALARKVGTSQRVESSDDMENVFNQGRMIADMDMNKGIELVKDAEVLSMQEDDTEVQEAVEIVTTAKLTTEVVTAAATQAVAASTPIPAAKPKILNIAAAPAVSTRRRKGVVIRDLKEELSFDTPAETPKVKDKGYKMDFFKGMKYDEILPIFQAKFNANMRFLFKSIEEMEEEDEEIIKSINETPAQKATKRRKLHEQAKEDEDLKK
nr:hypothetical protein [Tanacetum cinerariifolium]